MMFCTRNNEYADIVICRLLEFRVQFFAHRICGQLRDIAHKHLETITMCNRFKAESLLLDIHRRHIGN